MTYRRKLIGLALPLKTINKVSAREKFIRHVYPDTLRLWWTRRPLMTVLQRMAGSVWALSMREAA